MVWFFWKRRRYERMLEKVLHRQGNIMADLARLEAAVTANTQAVEDMKVLVAALKTGATDQATVDAMATQIETNNATLEALKTA